MLECNQNINNYKNSIETHICNNCSTNCVLHACLCFKYFTDISPLACQAVLRYTGINNLSRIKELGNDKVRISDQSVQYRIQVLKYYDMA